MATMNLPRITRRQAIGALTAAVGGLLEACSGSPTSASSTTSSSSTTTGGTSNAACAVTATETEGPYPDITGMLNNSAFYRRDVTEGKPGRYASGVYAAKGQNPQTNSSDGIFADGTSTELATMSGSAGGYTATLQIVVAV